MAYLSMSDCSSVCPSGTRYTLMLCVSLVHTCTQQQTLIRSQMAKYQKCSPDCLTNFHKDINGGNVDGVSITQGFPRQHVCTFATGVRENDYYSARTPGM